jgi:GWxTD domain-containing protein
MKSAIIAFRPLSPYFSFAMKISDIYRRHFVNAPGIIAARNIAVVVLLFSSTALAQFTHDLQRQEIDALNPVMVEAVPFWSEDTASIDLIVQYRINPTFLFFAKADDGQQNSFEARGELLIEILDESGVTITRAIKPLQIERSAALPEGNPQHRELQGAFSFHLKNRTYKIHLEAKDFESGKTFVPPEIKVDARFLSKSGLTLSHAILVEAKPADTSGGVKEFIPVNHGSSLIIGEDVGYLFQVFTPDTGAGLRLTWKVEEKGEASIDSQQQLGGDSCLQWTGVPELVERSGVPLYAIKSSSRHSRAVFVSFPSRRLEEGLYSFSVKMQQDTLKQTKAYIFSVIWPGKPRSLSIPNIAVNALRHIATEEQIDQMSSFSRSTAIKAFREFWKKKNPDTTSAYNPVMAEYYRRVDEAIRRFSSDNEPTGYRTDRGRIYILFGPPTKMDRLLKPNMPPTEVWTYEKLKRRFIFTDPEKTGNYSLVKEENY